MASKSVSSRGVEVNLFRFRVIGDPDGSNPPLPLLQKKILILQKLLILNLDSVAYWASVESRRGASDSIMGDRVVLDGEVTEMAGAANDWYCSFSTCTTSSC